MKPLTSEVRQILTVCLQGWKTSTIPLASREICFSWLADEYKRRFGVPLHQAKLRRLCNMGFLVRGNLARGKGRRYYKISDIKKIEDVLLENRAL